MRVIARSTLQEFWDAASDEDLEDALKAWLAEAKAADWKTPEDVKARYPKASIIADNRVIFNICGNRYRLVVHVNYEFGIILVRRNAREVR